MSRYFTRTHLLLAAIVLVAAFFRLYRLDQIPPGFQFDQAYYVFDALRLLQGQFSIFFAAPGGTEPLYIYLAMPGVALAGITPLGLKLTTALIGIVTIPLIYGFGRTMFSSVWAERGRQQVGVRVGLLAALFAAISIWHIYFSRYGERVVLLVLLTVLMYWFFWRALTPTRVSDGKPRWRFFALTGFFLALALYTYPGARVLPVALILLTAYAALTDRANTPRYVKGLLLAFAVAAMIFLPLAIYFVFHPDQFIGHTADVSIFAPHEGVQSSVLDAFTGNAVRLLGMFLGAGDAGMLRNVPNRPVFDPFTGALFAVGVIVALAALLSPRATALNRKRAMFLAVWIVVALAVSLFSDDAPNFVRTLPAMPAVMILPAWGAAEVWERLRAPMAHRAAIAALAVIVLVGAASSFRDYFIEFANDPGLYYAFNTDKVEIADWVNQNASAQTIFLAPVTYQVSTVSLLTRNAALKSFESRDTIVLPSRAAGKDVLFGFPPDQEKKIQTMAARLGALGARDDLNGSNGDKLLLVYRVPARNLPDAPQPLDALARGGAFIQPQKIEHAVWGDQLELIGYSVDAADAPKRNLEVTLFVRALKPMITDYTFSIKVRDGQGRVWGQEDKWLGDNSYATSQMNVGDVVIEKFYPGLNACAPAGDYLITVEAYDPKTSQVLSLSDRSSGAVSLGTTHADASEGNRLEDLEIDQKIDAQVAPQMELLGYTLTPPDAPADSALSLSLFWRGVGNGLPARSAAIQLRDAANREFALADRSIVLPAEGRGLCAFFDLRAPADAAVGTANIFVNHFKIATLNVTR